MTLSQIKCNKLKLLILYRRWEFLKDHFKYQTKEEVINRLVVILRDELTIFHAFNWDNTLEGKQFWKDVNDEKIIKITYLRLK